MQKAKRLLRVSAQIALLCAIYAACHAGAFALRLPIPGNVVGMGALFLLIATGAVPLAIVEEGADALLRHMNLLLIPASVGVLRYVGLLRADLFEVVLIVVSTTILVMVVTAAIAQALSAGPEESRAADPPAGSPE
jgi:holin-like protein